MSLPSTEELQSLLTELNDAAKAYSTTPDLNSFMSRMNIIEKAKKLANSLIAPEQIPNYHGLNMAELVALRTFIKLKVFEAIPTTGSISLAELSKATGAQDSLLERMSRILVATGFLDQTRPDGGEYMHTKFSKEYINLGGSKALFLAEYDEWFKNMVNFDDYLAEKGLLGHAAEPFDQLHNPYTWTHKSEGTPVWAIMARDPEKIQTFQIGLSGIDLAIPVVGHFDYSVLATGDDEDTIELIDVGGAAGAVLKQIIEKYPALNPKKCMLQERPDVIDMAKSLPKGELPEGLQFMPHDFLTEQPVKGAQAYFMRMILHDYSDPVCTQILSNISSAMSEHSRVLVCDMVLPERVNEATFPAAVLDQAVMSMGGKERTEEGFRKVFEGAGLELVKVWRAPGVPGGCVEGRLKR